MAAPSYTTDLATIELAEGVAWAEPTATGWTSLNIATTGETDYFIQGTQCNSGSVKTGVGGLLANFGSGVTIPTDGAFLIWAKWDAPNSLDTETNGGIRTMVGSALNAFYAFKHLGSNSYTYGGWVCLATGDPSVVTPDYTVGSPTSTRQYFGWAYNAPTNVPSKGNPYGADAIRYGRCEFRVNAGDLANGYATFAGMASKNDANDATNGYNRWGLFQAIEGGYKWQGLMTLGYTSAIDFRDSNKSIVVANTKKVTAGFNKIEIRQTGSRVDWSNIIITALGTVSKGNFEVVDDADINFDNCTFTDMGTFIFKANSTVSTTTFRRCDLVTTNSGTFTGCLFTSTINSIKAVTASSPLAASYISNSQFVSTGTKHGLEITGTASNATLTNLTWTGYAASNGTSGNEAVYINIAAGSMNLTITGGTVPSIRTAGCTVTVVSSAVSVTLKAITSTGTAILGANVLVKAAAGGPFPYSVTVTISNSGTTATVTHTAHAMATNDKVLIKGASLLVNNGVFTITKINDNSYSYTMGSAPGSSPTGTIKATFVVLSGTTDANGEITMSRVFSSNQPVSGWARKATSAPYYKTGPISGTVDTAKGAYFTSLLISDS